MKRLLLVIALFLLVFSAKAQDFYQLYKFDKLENTIELDITKISLFEQRAHILFLLNNDERFDVSNSGKDGVFIIKRNPNSYNFNLEDTFSSFYNDAITTFKSMSKNEVGEMFNEWKSSLPNVYIASMMMDMYVQDRQNNLCSSADPFCTDNGLYEFPAGVNAGSGETGPNYDCLHTTPNPAWYYMRMANAGGMTIYMYSTPSEDIDFCCWGPFDNPSSPCPNGLTIDKVVSCSYSSSATENCIIPDNAQSGKYYILVITNYSNHTCNINFSKTAGNGTTDCSILEPFLRANTPCVGSSLQLQADEITGASYTWTGPDNQTHNGRVWTRNNATLNMAGTYTCHVVAGTQSGDETLDVVVLPNVNSDFTFGTATAGQPVQFTGTETTTPSGHTSMITERYWNFGDNTTSTSANPTHTYSNAGTYNVSYTVKTTGGNEGLCEDTKTKTVTVTNQFNAVVSPQSTDLCENESTTLNVNATGGFGNYTYSWTPAQYVDYPNAATTMVHPPVGNTTFTCTVSDGNATLTPTATVAVHNIPTANAGEDFHVNFNGVATLTATAVSGASYSWAPASQINGNANQQTVQTIPLQEMTTFTLTVTSQYGCTDTDQITITVGNQLQGNIAITGPSPICDGEETTLTANPAGGTGNYNYSWSPANLVDNPNAQTTIVHPTLTQNQFTCTVNDGENTINMQTTITVNPQPEAVASSSYTNVLADNYVLLSVQPVANSTCSWEPANLISNIIDQWTVKTVNLPENDNIVFTATITEASGCSSQDQVLVHVYPSLETSTIATSNAVICENRTVTLTAQPEGGTGNYSYYWTPEEHVDNPQAQTVTALPDMNHHIFTCTIIDNGIDDPVNNKTIKTIDIEVREKPYIDTGLIGKSLVTPGAGIIPYIYEYNVDVLNLHGYGVDDPNTQYLWSLKTWGNVPNHVPGPTGESKWILQEDGRYTAYVMVNEEGYALLSCTIVTSCGTTHTDKFIYTSDEYLNYQYMDEVNYDEIVSIFPNPSNGEINIRFSGAASSETVSISIYSYNGMIIDRFENSAANSVRYSMDGYANGLYFINITGEDFSVTKKFLLNR